MFATHREALPFLFPWVSFCYQVPLLRVILCRYTRFFDNISWWIYVICFFVHQRMERLLTVLLKVVCWWCCYHTRCLFLCPTRTTVQSSYCQEWVRFCWRNCSTIFLIITVFSFLKAHSLSRQHRPYPKEGAWHRLRHFTLSALRLPEDAMQLNYNPGLDHSYCTRSRILMFAQNGTQFHHKKCFRNPKVSARIGLMALATTNVTWYVPSFVVHWFIITKLECSWNGSQVYQPQWLGHEFSLFPHVHSLKPIAECIEGTFLTISKGVMPSLWPIEFSDGGESARWGLVFRVLEQQQQAILALQRQLNANG